MTDQERQERSSDVVLTSKSQTPDQLRVVAESLGYTVTEELTDQPTEQQQDGTIPAEPQVDPTISSTPAIDVAPPVVEAAADASETDADLDPAIPVQETPAPAQPLSRHKRQIQKRDAEIARIKTDNEAKDRELAELRAKAGQPRSEPAPAAVDAPVVSEDEPIPEYDDSKYASYELYLAALGAVGYRNEQRASERQKRIASETTAAETQRTLAEEARQQLETNKAVEEEGWQASVAIARKSVADFDTVMSTPRPGVVVPPLIVTAVRDRDQGALIAHWLITHPADEQKLIGLVKLPAKPSDRQVRATYTALSNELDRITALLPAAVEDPDIDPDL